MSYINAELRKSDLLVDAAEATLNAVAKVKSVLAKTVAVIFATKAKPRIDTVSDYYAKAPKRSNAFTSIDRELAAKGNAW